MKANTYPSSIMFNFKKLTRKHLQKHKKSKLKFVGKNDLSTSIRTHLYSTNIHKLKPIDEGIKSKP